MSVEIATISFCPVAKSPAAKRIPAYTRHIPAHAGGELMTDQYRGVWPGRPESRQHPGISPAAPEPAYPPLPADSVSAPGYDHATWGQRVRARLIDQAPTYVGLIIFVAGYLVWVVELAQSGGSIPQSEGAVVAMIIGLSVMLASLAWVAYNRWMIAGRTGQSLGKRLTKIMLIGNETKAPVGPLNAFVRDLVHILDGLTVVGYLWPRWDADKQTFGDKIMKTIVINVEPSN